jgi:protein-tyrosine phosphatase
MVLFELWYIMMPFIVFSLFVLGLFIGTKTAGADLEQLRRFDIARVVNVGAGECHFEQEGVKYLKIGVADKEDADLMLNETTQWIEDVFAKSDGCVLIHCMGCFSRSPSVAIAYLIRYRKLSFDQALQVVKRQRSCACPNKGFEKQLRNFEKETRKKNL